MAPARALPLVLFALAGCATLPAGPPPPPPELSFRGVKTVALLHRLEGLGTSGTGDARRRDPLDALQRALAARGVKTVTVELTERPPPELDAVEQAARLAESNAEAARAGMGGPAVATVGELAAPALQQLDADAFAVFARGGGWGMPAAPPPRFGSGWSMAPPPAPASALSVVARDGTVVTFAWGGGAEPFPSGLANAAEAVDAALALLLQPPPE